MGEKPKRIKPGQTWKYLKLKEWREFEVSKVRKGDDGITYVYGKTPVGKAVHFPFEEVRDSERFAFLYSKLVRAIRLELVKPLSHPWDEVGPLLRLLASATPKLTNAAYDALVAIELVGKSMVKAVIAPEAKANTPDGIAYQAVLKSIEDLKEWHPKGETKHPYADLRMPGGMTSAIARAASQAFQRRDQGRVSFESKRILVRGQETEFRADNKGVTLSLGLRPGAGGRVDFAMVHSRGSHRDTVKGIVNGSIPHGDCKLQYDEHRKKWYALVAYNAPVRALPQCDPGHTLVVHRGIRNALYLFSSTGQTKPIPGSKYVAQRRGLQARMRDVRRVSVDERGEAAKGHGWSRRTEVDQSLEGKLGRVTHTFCQQMAASVSRMAQAWGCGTIVIEDYGGIQPDEDPTMRKVLDRFPLYEMKQCITSRLERDGLILQEVPSAYISTTCPRCKAAEARLHNKRTGMFHCLDCQFTRPADWVASYWMLEHSGADMKVWHKRMREEEELGEQLRRKSA